YVLLCVEAVVEVLDRAGVGRRDLGPRWATVGRPEQSLVRDHRDDAIDTGGRDIAGGPASAGLCREHGPRQSTIQRISAQLRTIVDDAHDVCMVRCGV